MSHERWRNVDPEPRVRPKVENSGLPDFVRGSVADVGWWIWLRGNRELTKRNAPSRKISDPQETFMPELVPDPPTTPTLLSAVDGAALVLLCLHQWRLQVASIEDPGRNQVDAIRSMRSCSSSTTDWNQWTRDWGLEHWPMYLWTSSKKQPGRWEVWMWYWGNYWRKGRGNRERIQEKRESAGMRLHGLQIRVESVDAQWLQI